MSGNASEVSEQYALTRLEHELRTAHEAVAAAAEAVSARMRSSQDLADEAEVRKMELVLRLAMMRREKAEAALAAHVPSPSASPRAAFVAAPGRSGDDDTTQAEVEAEARARVEQARVATELRARADAKARYEDLRLAKAKTAAATNEWEQRMVGSASRALRASEKARAAERQRANERFRALTHVAGMETAAPSDASAGRASKSKHATAGTSSEKSAADGPTKKRVSSSSKGKKGKGAMAAKRLSGGLTGGDDEEEDASAAAFAALAAYAPSSYAAPSAAPAGGETAMSARERLFSVRNERLKAEHAARTMRNHGDYVLQGYQRAGEQANVERNLMERRAVDAAAVVDRAAAERAATIAARERQNVYERRMNRRRRLGGGGAEDAHMEAQRAGLLEPGDIWGTLHAAMVDRAREVMEKRMRGAAELREQKKAMAQLVNTRQEQHRARARAQADRAKEPSREALEVQDRMREHQDAVNAAIRARTADEEARRDRARRAIEQMGPILSEISPDWMSRNPLATEEQRAAAGGAAGEASDEHQRAASCCTGSCVCVGSAAQAWATATSPGGASATGGGSAAGGSGNVSPGASAANVGYGEKSAHEWKARGGVARAWDSGAIDKAWRRIGDGPEPPSSKARYIAAPRGKGRKDGKTPPPPPMPRELVSAFERLDKEGRSLAKGRPPSNPTRGAGPPAPPPPRGAASGASSPVLDSVFVRSIFTDGDQR